MLRTSQSAGWSREDDDRVALLRGHAEHLAPPLSAEFADPFDIFGSAKLVLLGEATHGTGEFYRVRAAITRRLIEKHQFNIVAFEADWPDMARTAFGNDMIAIGFGTDHGRVAAAASWDRPMRIMNVIPARDDSYEALFRETRLPRSLTQWTGVQRKDVRDALREPKLERAIGVVYRPESELASHYFRAVMPEQFDAFVWFEESSPITPIGALLTGPETYPTGL